jgi:pyruvate/2-oxoglutarate dehydrogenase complex dihydrolipoamide acyltransferase (E2) component
MANFDVVVPVAGMTTVEGVLGEWLVAVGDVVSAGQDLAVVEFEKVDVHIETEHGGQVLELLVEEGASVEPGSAIAKIEIG